MYRLDAFKLEDMILCGADIRQIGLESRCVEEAAEKVVKHLYENLLDEEGKSALALVRLYKTMRFGELDSNLRTVARQSFGSEQGSFLTLMATVGMMDSWNDRRKTERHQLIPSNDETQMMQHVPILAHLRLQLEMGSSWRPLDESLLKYVMEPEQKRFNVFFVPNINDYSSPEREALIESCGVRSMLAYGAMLSPGSFFGVVLYSRIVLPKNSAEMFSPLALSTKNAIIYSTNFRPFAANA